MNRDDFGKKHCGNPDHCEKEPYAEDRCDCSCASRCGPWNDYLEQEERAEQARERQKETEPMRVFDCKEGALEALRTLREHLPSRTSLDLLETLFQQIPDGILTPEDATSILDTVRWMISAEAELWIKFIERIHAVIARRRTERISS